MATGYQVRGFGFAFICISASAGAAYLAATQLPTLQSLIQNEVSSSTGSSGDIGTSAIKPNSAPSLQTSSPHDNAQSGTSSKEPDAPIEFQKKAFASAVGEFIVASRSCNLKLADPSDQNIERYAASRGFEGKDFEPDGKYFSDLNRAGQSLEAAIKTDGVEEACSNAGLRISSILPEAYTGIPDNSPATPSADTGAQPAQ